MATEPTTCTEAEIIHLRRLRRRANAEATKAVVRAGVKLDPRVLASRKEV